MQELARRWSQRELITQDQIGILDRGIFPRVPFGSVEDD